MYVTSDGTLGGDSDPRTAELSFFSPVKPTGQLNFLLHLSTWAHVSIF